MPKVNRGTAEGANTGTGASDGVLSAVQNFVTTAQLLRTLVGLIVGMVMAALAVYNHFAKASELAELACKVVEQNEINNEMINTSRDIQSALRLLKENFESSTQPPISTQFMASQIAAAVDRIDKSMGKVNETRQNAQKKAITKEREC